MNTPPTVELQGKFLVWRDDESGALELPLQTSTVAVLNFFEHAVPSPKNVSADEEEDDETMLDTTAISETAMDTTTGNASEEEEAKTENGETALVQKFGSGDIIFKAIQHIRGFRREDEDSVDDAEQAEAAGDAKGESRDKKRKNKKQNARLEALQHKVDRLQKQRAGERITEDTDSTSCDDLLKDAWLVFVRQANSFVALLSLLVPMLQHEKQEDKEFMGKTLKSNNKKKNFSWVIGDSVFDRVNRRQWTQLKGCTKEMCDEMGLDMCAPNLDMDLQELMTKNCSLIRGSIPLAATVVSQWTTEQEQRLRELDQRFQLRHEEDEDPHRVGYEVAVRRLHLRVSDLLRDSFPGSTVSIYGSCLSNLSVGKGSDVDLSLHVDSLQRDRQDFETGKIEVKKYQTIVKKAVYKACGRLERSGGAEFENMNPIWRARVPVVSGSYTQARNPYNENGSLDFDICFLNDIAVANSNLIREYSLVDFRVKMLMKLVKQWAKDIGIGSAKDSTLSSYTWLNLVIFFLQAKEMVPNLQSRELASKAEVTRDDSDRWNHVNDLDTFFLRWEQVQAVWKPPHEPSYSMTELLHGFMKFYSREHRLEYLVSIKRGPNRVPVTAFRKCCAGALVVEDPFETFSSHCPHDLGMHASREGMKKIKSCLAEAFIRLEGFIASNETAEEASWYTPAVKKAPQPKEQRKSRRQKGKQQQNKKDQGNQKQQQNKKDQGNQKQQKKGKKQTEAQVASGPSERAQSTGEPTADGGEQTDAINQTGATDRDTTQRQGGRGRAGSPGRGRGRGGRGRGRGRRGRRRKERGGSPGRGAGGGDASGPGGSNQEVNVTAAA